MAIPSTISLFPVVEILFISFRLLGLLATIHSFFCYHCQVCNLASGSFYHISRFDKSDNLLNFFKIFIARM